VKGLSCTGFSLFFWFSLPQIKTTQAEQVAEKYPPYGFGSAGVSPAIFVLVSRRKTASETPALPKTTLTIGRRSNYSKRVRCQG
jgi:hypothetical protein